MTIKELAQFIGNVEALFKTVLTEHLYNRDMETLKITKLKENKGKSDANILIKEESKTEIKWRIENIKDCSRNLISREVDSQQHRLGW